MSNHLVFCHFHPFVNCQSMFVIGNIIRYQQNFNITELRQNLQVGFNSLLSHLMIKYLSDESFLQDWGMLLMKYYILMTVTKLYCLMRNFLVWPRWREPGRWIASRDSLIARYTLKSQAGHIHRWFMPFFHFQFFLCMFVWFIAYPFGQAGHIHRWQDCRFLSFSFFKFFI